MVQYSETEVSGADSLPRGSSEWWKIWHLLSQALRGSHAQSLRSIESPSQKCQPAPLLDDRENHNNH